MPNILLTTYCNRRCPYCFALDAMDGAGQREMTMRELVTVADMIVASGRMNTGLLGGEPTLHPQFRDVACYLIARGIRVRVFTNGLCRESLMDQLEPMVRGDRLKFVVNVNLPGVDSEAQRTQQEAFIKRFARACDLGVNLFRADAAPTFLSELARRTGVRNHRIRVGLAQPIVGEANTFLSLDDYRQVAGGIVVLAEAVFDLGIIVSLDCGFPLCAFTDEQLGRLRRVRADAKFICSTATDIAPGLVSWSCFPLAGHNRAQVETGATLKQIEDSFLQMNDDHRKRSRKGVFKECDTCPYFEQRVCGGGCLAHVISGNGAPREA